MWAVHYLANHLLLRRLLSSGVIPNDVYAANGRAGDAIPRVVLVASEAHRSSSGIDFDHLAAFKPYGLRDAMVHYADSKLGLVTFATELARRLAVDGRPSVAVHGLCPGGIASGITRDAPSLLRPGDRCDAAADFSEPGTSGRAGRLPRRRSRALRRDRLVPALDGAKKPVRAGYRSRKRPAAVDARREHARAVDRRGGLMFAAVTGASGMLGNTLVRSLLVRGDRVRVLEPSAGTPESLAGLDLDFVRGIGARRFRHPPPGRGVDCVFHLAAKIDLDRDRDGTIHAVNVEGTRIVAEACARGAACAWCTVRRTPPW